METRKIKAIQLFKDGAVKKLDEGFAVRSQTSKWFYYVDDSLKCNCPDCTLNGTEVCKHAYAVKYYLGIEKVNGTTTKIRLTYPQAWHAYTEAQTNEVKEFDELLKDLVSDIPDEEYTFGRPKLSQKELLFCSIQKVYTNTQTNLPEAGFANGAGTEKSILTLKDYNEKPDEAFYSVIQYSNVIKKPIRAFISPADFESYFTNHDINISNFKGKVTELGAGYQEIQKFEAMIDFKANEIFMSAKKEDAHLFITRLLNCGLLEYEQCSFDLSKVDEITEIPNVWGAWETSSGNCKKRAYFGVDINHLDDIDNKRVTSYNVNYNYGDFTIDLCITADGRISSKATIVNTTDLTKIYYKLKAHLMKVDEDKTK